MIRYFLAMAILATSSVAAAADKPNILWIVVEDASPNIGCYGETAIKTPTLAQLAREGVRLDS